MDTQLARRIAAVEDVHWWYRGRRRVLDSVLLSTNLPATSDILDAGCGSGGNLALLARHGRLVALEYDRYSAVQAQERGICQVTVGSLPEDVPFDDASFDLITLLDVLEHIEDDCAALRRLHELLRAEGRLLITVPAYQCLWSRHDDANQHFRRYSRRTLRRVLAAAGFEVERLSYFNTMLFPPIALVRLLDRVGFMRPQRSLLLPPAPINRLLAAIFSFERHIVRRFSMPFGVSLIAVASRAAD